MSNGHLFVVEGDLTGLACDAWLLPTDDGFYVTGSFASAAGMPCEGFLPGFDSWPGGPVQPLSVVAPDNEPWIWLGEVGTANPDPSRFATIGAIFVERAATAIRANQSAAAPDVPRRVRPLLAVNLIGSGEGGGYWLKGELCRELIEKLSGAATACDADVVLVTWGRKAYSAAQRARRRLVGSSVAHDCPSWDLGPRSEGLLQVATELGRCARLGYLVLFIGSGASVDAGVPTWRELIASVAKRAGLDESLAKKLQALDPRDAATVLKRRTGTDATELRKLISDEVGASRYSLTHALLASLDTRESVTTNYDQLFEMAADDPRDPLAVLPFDGVELGQRWLLKLHGSIEHLDSIVFTRDDYLGAAATYGALYGLLQALLMTKAMLFVGYSLSDEDFHAVMNEVTRVLTRRSGGESLPAGSDDVARSIARVLTLEQDPVFDDIWSEVTTILPMSDVDEGLSAAEQARRMQIFLDLVGFEAADTSAFLLDDAYEGLLDDAERELRDALRQLEHEAPTPPSGESWAPVYELLKRYGADP